MSLKDRESERELCDKIARQLKHLAGVAEKYEIGSSSAGLYN